MLNELYTILHIEFCPLQKNIFGKEVYIHPHRVAYSLCMQCLGLMLWSTPHAGSAPSLTTVRRRLRHLASSTTIYVSSRKSTNLGYSLKITALVNGMKFFSPFRHFLCHEWVSLGLSTQHNLVYMPTIVVMVQLFWHGSTPKPQSGCFVRNSSLAPHSHKVGLAQRNHFENFWSGLPHIHSGWVFVLYNRSTVIRKKT